MKNHLDKKILGDYFIYIYCAYRLNISKIHLKIYKFYRNLKFLLTNRKSMI